MGKANLPSVDMKPGQELKLQQNETIQPIDNATVLQQIGESYREHVASEGYAARMVDVRMTGEQPNKFKKIARHLEDIGAQLVDGSPVNNNRRVALWLIENFDIPNR